MLKKIIDIKNRLFYRFLARRKFELTIEGENRAKSFVSEVIKDECIYYLSPGEDRVTRCFSTKHKNRNVIPFWTKKYLPYARKWAKNGEQLVSVDSYQFFEYVLPDLISTNDLLGMNWSQHGCGIEVEPNDILSQVSFNDSIGVDTN